MIKVAQILRVELARVDVEPPHCVFVAVRVGFLDALPVGGDRDVELRTVQRAVVGNLMDRVLAAGFSIDGRADFFAIVTAVRVRRRSEETKV